MSRLHVFSLISFLVALAGCGASSATVAKAPASTAAEPAPAAGGERHPYDVAEWGPPGARVFAPGLVSDGQVFASAFEPDGRTVYFVSSGRARGALSLRMSRYRDGAWSTPEAPPFAVPGAREIDPFFLGNRLYYNSNRPAPAASPGEPPRTDLDVWIVERTAAGFGTPRNLGAPINTPGADFFATATEAGTLYYVSMQGQERAIYRAAALPGGGYAAPERLPDVINDGRASNPHIDRHERFLLFLAERPGGLGDSDLYLSVRTASGWSEAEPLGPLVNTADQEFCPSISPDGKHLFFSRSRNIPDSSPPRYEWEDIFYLPVSQVPALARAMALPAARRLRR